MAKVQNHVQIHNLQIQIDSLVQIIVKIHLKFKQMKLNLIKMIKQESLSLGGGQSMGYKIKLNIKDYHKQEI